MKTTETKQISLGTLKEQLNSFADDSQVVFTVEGQTVAFEGVQPGADKKVELRLKEVEGQPLLSHLKK